MMSTVSRYVHELGPQVRRGVVDTICAELTRGTFADGCRLLDIGCWDGHTTVRYAEAARIGANATFGVEVASEPAALAAQRFNAVRLDAERERLPYPDAFFDVVVTNQVFEHLKQVFLPMDEIARVTRPGGHLLFSVPNLASLHNRVLLALGRQPTTIRVFGPHVRAFTWRETRTFIEFNGAFRVVRWQGVGFYPLPLRLARPFARLLRGMSHTPVFHAIRMAGPPGWLDEIRRDNVETHFD